MIVVLVQCETCNVRAPAEVAEGEEGGVVFDFPASWFFSAAFGHFCTRHCALTDPNWSPAVLNEEREKIIDGWERGALK